MLFRVKLKPVFTTYALEEAKANLVFSLFLVSVKKEYFRFVSVGQLGFDHCLYCGRDRLMQGSG